MFCPNCGKEIEDGAQSCAACGTVLNVVPAETKDDSNVLAGSFLNNKIDGLISALRGVRWDKGFDCAERGTISIGIWGYYLLALFSLITFPIICSKVEMTGIGFLMGFVFLVFCVIFGYCGTKLYGSIRNLIDNIPSSVSSMNIVDMLAVISIVAAIFGSAVCFVIGNNDTAQMVMMMAGVSTDGFNGIGVGVLIGGIYIFIMLVGAKSLLGVKEEKCGSAEEFLGIVTMFIKMAARLTPFIWALGAFAAVVLEIVALVSGEDGDFIVNTGVAVSVAVMTGFFPLIIYINYITYNFVLDFAKSVLSVPGKIDALKK